MTLRLRPLTVLDRDCKPMGILMFWGPLSMDVLARNEQGKWRLFSKRALHTWSDSPWTSHPVPLELLPVIEESATEAARRSTLRDTVRLDELHWALST